MWSTEHSIETSATPEAVWLAWADVPRWAEWNGDIARIELRGPFAADSTIAMTPRGQDQDVVMLRLAEVVAGERFVDEAEVAGTVVRTTHSIEQIDGPGIRVVYRLEASGPAAEEIGPAVSSDFDETLRSLVRHIDG